jgi:hypothetical protein
MGPSRIRFVITLLLLLVFVGWMIPAAANFVIEYNWWKEVGQVPTWFSILWYRSTPVALGTLLAFVSLYLAHARGLHFAGIRSRDVGLYSRLIAVGLALVALMFASVSIDYWTVMRFFGSRGLSASPRRLEGPGFLPSLAVLPVRPALLLRPARLCIRIGDSSCLGFPGKSSGMAVDRPLSI